MNKLGGIGGIIGLIAIVAGAFFVLNYFNVISLSLLYPKYFGSLPHNPIYQLQTPRSQAFLSCPTIAQPCGGEQIIANGRYMGLGFKVPPGAEILSVFSGTAVFKRDAVVNHVNITGKGEALGYEAIYDYFGPSSSSAKLDVKEVTRNDSLNKVGSGTFNQGGVNLIFRLLDRNGKNIELKTSDFTN